MKRKPYRKKIKYVENKLQVKCVRWFRREHKEYLIWCSLNGVATDPRKKAQWKKDGMLKGVPDLQILIQDKTIFVELKRPTTYKVSEKTGKRIIKSAGGTTSSDQDEFIAKAKKLGHDCYVVDNLDDFKKIIKSYI